MHDPQNLDFWGKISALIALGRIPFAIEVSLATLLGCILSSQIFPSNPITSGGTSWSGGSIWSNLDIWVTIQCMLVTWGTNVAINYGNEWFDYDLDRPGQVAAITRDVQARKKLAQIQVNGHIKEDGGKEEKEIGNAKIMGNTTRIIHDGTFPPWTALACCAVWQLGLVALILTSRYLDPLINPSPPITPKSEIDMTTPTPSTSLETGNTSAGSPFQGLALHLGIICTLLSHSYVGPPLRLHYNGWGELVSALFLGPVAVLFGMVGHYTAITHRPVTWHDLISRGSFSGDRFHLDASLWLLLAGMYFFEQARILVMHVHDIEADIAGGKRTFVSRIGHRSAKDLYGILNIALIICWGFFIKSLWNGNSMFWRVAGMTVDRAGGEAIAKAWAVGMGVIMAFSIPIMWTTYGTLIREIKLASAREATKTEERGRKHKTFHGHPVHQAVSNGNGKGNGNGSSKEGEGLVDDLKTIPQGLDMLDCAKLVSLQTLGTQVVMAVVTTSAAYMGGRAHGRV